MVLIFSLKPGFDAFRVRRYTIDVTTDDGLRDPLFQELHDSLPAHSIADGNGLRRPPADKVKEDDAPLNVYARQMREDRHLGRERDTVAADFPTHITEAPRRDRFLFHWPTLQAWYRHRQSISPPAPGRPDNPGRPPEKSDYWLYAEARPTRLTSVVLPVFLLELMK